MLNNAMSNRQSKKENAYPVDIVIPKKRVSRKKCG